MNQEAAFFETGGRPVKRWSAEMVAIVRRMTDDGASVADMARAIGEERTTLRGKAKRYGIHIAPRATPGSRLDAADAVLHAEYPTNPSIHAVHALYCEAIGGHRRMSSMQQRAQMLRLTRACVSRADVVANAGKASADKFAALRLAKVPEVQRRFDAGQSFKQVLAEMGMGRETLRRMVDDGLVAKRARLAPVATSPKPPRAPSPPKPRKPRVWVYSAPAAPKPRAQTVEEWLAMGGQITRLPAAAVCATQATIPAADVEALRAYRAATPENGNWMQQRRAWVARNKGTGVMAV